MKVLKFGGTSVGTAESISLVKQIVEAETEPVIVVVSALGGITDRLILMAHQAAAGDMGYETEFFICLLCRKGCGGYFAGGFVFLMRHLEMWIFVTIFADDENSLFKIRKELL